MARDHGVAKGLADDGQRFRRLLEELVAHGHAPVDLAAEIASLVFISPLVPQEFARPQCSDVAAKRPGSQPETVRLKRRTHLKARLEPVLGPARTRTGPSSQTPN